MYTLSLDMDQEASNLWRQKSQTGVYPGSNKSSPYKPSDPYNFGFYTSESQQTPATIKQLTANVPDASWTANSQQTHPQSFPTSYSAPSLPNGQLYPAPPPDWASYMQQRVSADRYATSPLEQLPLDPSRASEYRPSDHGQQESQLQPHLWNHKQDENPPQYYPFASEVQIGQTYTADDAVSTAELRPSSQSVEASVHKAPDNLTQGPASSLATSSSRRYSTGLEFSDFAAGTSDQPHAYFDYPVIQNRGTLMPLAHQSPAVTPRSSVQPSILPDHHRTQSRRGSLGKATPSPRSSLRSTAYSLEGTTGAAGWTSGLLGTQHSNHSHTAYPLNQDTSGQSERSALQNSSAPNYHHIAAATHAMATPRSHFVNQGQLMPGDQHQSLMQGHAQQHQHIMDRRHNLPQAPTLASHGLLRMLQSNVDTFSLRNQSAENAEPPDLYASLHQDAASPPAEDKNPSDPDMTPSEQESRFEGDLYTPKLVRGHGNKREGWCGFCKPGRWLVLKNSAYWYDKSFAHGISAATGAPFQEPLEKRRMDGNSDVWEGLCGSCNQWIALVSSKKKGTTWFRHAYKCHVHTKVKDVPKRRRESADGAPAYSTDDNLASDRGRQQVKRIKPTRT